VKKIKKQFLFKRNEENERKRRLNHVLNKKYEKDDSFEEKKNKISKKLAKTSGLDSTVVSKLLKYCKKDIKKKQNNLTKNY